MVKSKCVSKELEKLPKFERYVKRKCPSCKANLVQTYLFNPELFGRTKANPRIILCRNNKCKGWYCSYCQEWHPYNTDCVMAMMKSRGVSSYKEWKDSKKGLDLDKKELLTRMENILKEHVIDREDREVKSVLSQIRKWKRRLES